jgi:hypothetical protein
MCLRNFFARQKVDEIGIYSVKLQKILIVLMVFNTLSLFLGGFSSLLGFLIEFILLWVCFIGAVKRSQRHLRAYVCINITIMIITIVVFFALIIMATSAHPKTDEPQSGIADPNQPAPTANPNARRDDIPNNTPSNTTIPTPTDPSVAHGLTPREIAIAFFLIFSSIFVMILKVASMVMALRLARMICAYNLQHLSHPTTYQPVPQKEEQLQQPNFIPMTPQGAYAQPMFVPVVINGQPNGQPQQFIYPNPYFVPINSYTPPPQQTNNQA